MHRFVALLILTFLPVVGLSRLAHAQSNPDKITLGTITLCLNNLPIYVAQDKGFYAKENLFLEA